MHEFAQATSILKLHDSRDLGKQRIVAANPYIDSGLISCSALPDDDGASIDKLSCKSLHSEPFGLAIPSVSGASHSLFVCHFSLLACYLDFFDSDGRLLLTMPARTSILLLRFIFEDKDFVVLL